MKTYDGICVGGPEDGRRWALDNRQFSSPIRRETTTQAYDGMDVVHARVIDSHVIYEWRTLYGVGFWALMSSRPEHNMSALVSGYRPIFPSAY